jgi:glycosyltransferase involved in cell wall biosynthesis
VSHSRNIIWRGAATDPSGYGEATRNYVLGLADAAAVKLQNESFFKGQPCLNHWATLERLRRTRVDNDKPHTYVQHLTPENYVTLPGQHVYHVGMTTFETDRIPDQWRTPMRAMDEIWTHSTWGKTVFEEQGIRNVKVVPHGVDTKRFTPEGPALGVIEESGLGRSFLFGSNFDWTERKNPRALLRAFLGEFGPDDDAALVIKSYHQFPLERSRAYIRGYIESVRKELGKRKGDSAPIYVISDMLDGEDLPSFYRSLDAYVLPTRGEGWGLTYSEAMACAVPTIGTGWGGNTQFMNTRNSVLLSSKLVPITAEQAGPQRQYAGHRWAEVDVDELRVVMRKLYESNSLAQFGAVARGDMVKYFSWENACVQAIDALEFDVAF